MVFAGSAAGLLGAGVACDAVDAPELDVVLDEAVDVEPLVDDVVDEDEEGFDEELLAALVEPDDVVDPEEPELP